MKNIGSPFTFDGEADTGFAPTAFGSTQILVTGGTGFIGRHVVRRLLARKARVRLFCRSPEKAFRLFGDRVGIARGDLRDRSSVAMAMPGCETVIHLGATFQFGRTTRRQNEETNLSGTKHLLEAAGRNGIQRFVHVSSCGVLAGDREMLTERDFPEAISPRETYRHSKWQAEKAALAAARHGLPVTIATPTSPLGEGDEGPTPTGRIVRDYVHGRFPVGARVGLNFCHVADLADGILAVAARGRIAERYLLGHHNVWLDDFLRVLARVSNRRSPRFTVPQAAVTLGGVVGEIVGSHWVCWETAAHARRRQWFDFSKASRELGWRPQKSLEAIALESVQWFQGASVPNPAVVFTEPKVAAS